MEFRNIGLATNRNKIRWVTKIAKIEIKYISAKYNYKYKIQ